MFERVRNFASKGVLQVIAVVIAFLLAGPEILIGIELMGLIEILGISTFFVAYFSGFKLFVDQIAVMYRRIEVHTYWFMPTFDAVKTMPALLIHVVPERTTLTGFICLMLVAPPVILWHLVV